MLGFVKDLAGAVYDVLKFIIWAVAYLFAGMIIVAVPLYLIAWLFGFSQEGTTNIYLNLFALFISLITVLLFSTFCFRLFIFFIKKEPFPKKLFLATLIGIGMVSTYVVYNQYFFTFDNYEGEFYKGPVNSPTDQYTANAYYMTYGGAAGGVNLWIEITDHETDKVKTIYYSDAKSKFSMEWKDEATISIVNEEPEYPSSNRSIELDIESEIYHDTGLACQSWVMKDAYETCYQNGSG